MEAPSTIPHLYVVRDPERLGSLLRPYSRDFAHLTNLVASGRPTGTGVIIDGRHLAQAAELTEAVRAKGQEIVLDSLGVEVFSPGGLAQPSIKSLPWVPRKRHASTPLDADEQRMLVEELAKAAIEARCTAVLAPTRFIQDIERDEVARDIDTAVALRHALDSAGGLKVRVYYPFIASLGLIASETVRQGILATLRGAVVANAIDAIWIRAIGFDAHSGATNLRRYVTGVRGFHELRVPVVGDRAGTLGLPMLALGVTSAITSGITMGERYNPRPLFKPERGKGFIPPPRVYVPAIGAFLDRKRAAEILKHVSLKNWCTCQRMCCRERGLSDMLDDPRRHFVVTRSEEVADLARIPTELRASQYMETWLRPASDRATKAMRVDPSLEGHRNRIDAWRATLGSILQEDALARPQASRSAVRLPSRKGA
jgi:hypothetical protein